MSFKQFIDQLFQFCFRRRGIAWQNPPRVVGAPNADPIFEDIIGNAVLNTSIEFQQVVHPHSTALLNYMSNLPVPSHYWALLRRIDVVSDDILVNGIYESKTQAAFVFLAIMVDVATQYARNGNRLVVQTIALVVVFILDSPMPYDFIENFNKFVFYAFLHGQPPGN